MQYASRSDKSVAEGGGAVIGAGVGARLGVGFGAGVDVIAHAQLATLGDAQVFKVTLQCKAFGHVI